MMRRAPIMLACLALPLASLAQCIVAHVVPPEILAPAQQQEYDYVPSLVWWKVNNDIPPTGNTGSTSTWGRIGLGTASTYIDGKTIWAATPLVYNGQLYLFYTGDGNWAGTTRRAWACASNVGGDMLTFVKLNNSPDSALDSGGGAGSAGRIMQGSSGRADDFQVHFGSAFSVGSVFYALYGGRYQSDGLSCGMIATGTTPFAWAKIDNTTANRISSGATCTNKIPMGGSGSGDVNNVLPIASIVTGGVVVIIYQASDASNVGRIYTATSSLARWTNGEYVITKLNNAIPSPSDSVGTEGRIPLGTSGKGDASGIFHGQIARLPNGLYYMTYSGFDGSYWRVYSATSSDLRTWYKVTNAVPSASDTSNTWGRIGLGTTGKGDANGILNPAVIYSNETLWCYYSAVDASGVYRIYCATQTVFKVPK